MIKGVVAGKVKLRNGKQPSSASSSLGVCGSCIVLGGVGQSEVQRPVFEGTA
jgi:hypothetical protein